MNAFNSFGTLDGRTLGGDIQLHDFVASHLARVGDLDCRSEPIVRPELILLQTELGIADRGIAQAEAEWEGRLGPSRSSLP